MKTSTLLKFIREIASLTPLFAGVTYERLEAYKSLQWPIAPDGTDQPLLYTKEFPFPDGNARLFPLDLSGLHFKSCGVPGNRLWR
jgi:formate dehydrogenase major subunit